MAGVSMFILLPALVLLTFWAKSSWDEVSAEAWIAWTAGGTIIAGFVVGGFRAFEDAEMRAGPWIIIQDEMIILPREDKRFALTDCHGWTVFYRRESGDEYVVGFVALVTADQQVHGILGSICHHDVKKLRDTLAGATGLAVLPDFEKGDKYSFWKQWIVTGKWRKSRR